MNKLFSQISRQAWSLVAACSMFLVFSQSAHAFVHPGIPFTTDDINQLKANLNTAPWSTGYASFAAQSQSSLGYTGNPCAAVSRAPDVNLTSFRNDMIAIHNLTWMWQFTNNAAYAQKATDLLDAWAVTNTYFGGDEACLDLGDYSDKLVTAADMLKAMYPGWTAANTTHVNAWFTNVLWPVADVPNPVRGANQGAIQLKIAVSIAAFLDDPTKWNQALSVYRDDAAGGLANSLANGQLGDTGRDDGHWLGQLHALTWSAEVAWKQGVDMFSELDNRLLATSELWAEWSLGEALPTFIPNGGAYQFNYPGLYAGGATPSIRQAYAYNIIENAYVRRLGLTAPKTIALHAVAGDDAGTFLFRKSADTSTATQLPAIVRPASAPAANFTNRDVGDVGLAGRASYDAGAGTWTVTGAGADIPIPPQTAVDAFNYAFQPITGDAVIVARVTAQQTGRAGIMIRESLAADAKYVGIFLNSSGGTVTTWRGATGWNKTNASWNNPPGGYQGASVPPAPWWFKIERLGTRVHVLHSPDGVNWSGIQSAEIAALPATAYIGLCVTSQNTSALSTATFDNVYITPSGPVGAPMITSATAVTATVGTTFSYATTASGSPTTYAATGLPAGLGIDAATGIISGTPTAPGTSLVTLSATNGSGTGTATLALTVLSDSAPAAPTGVTATAVNVYNVNIAWTASANATSYSVKRATTPGGPYTTIITGVSGTSYLDTAAPSGNVYYVVTALANALESAPSGEALIALSPGIPPAPTIINGNGQVTLSWPAASGATSYTIKRAIVSGGPYTTIASGVTTTSYTDTGLTNGTYYYYVVSSVSSVESANSPEEFGLPGAATYTWSPTASSGTWNTAANWVGGAVPSSPAILKFGASTATALSNDITGLDVARFTFDAGAPAYTITGNSITLGTEITNNSTSRQTIQVPMVISRTINSNPYAGEIMVGSITAGSVISGTGGFVTRGDSYTSFLGNNTFSGGVTAYGKLTAANIFSPRTLAFSGVGTQAYGPFGTGQVTLVNALLNDTQPFVPNGAFGFRNVLYNDIMISTGTQNAISTAGAGALDHYGKLLGGGAVEVAGWNSGWDNYSGSPSFYGDNSGFTGTFITLTHSSFQRLGFNTPTAGSALAKFSIGGNINATQSAFTTAISFGELSGAGVLNGSANISVGALNTDSTWAGVIYGSNAITKLGTGSFTMTFVNTYSGATTVNAGTVRVNTPGSITSAVTVNSGGTFGGTGTTSSTVAVASGGKFTPGYQGSGVFTTSGALTLATGSSFGFEFSSSTGTGAAAKVPLATLNNATLNLTDLAPGALPLGTVYTLINNTGSSAVSGTFNGLAEGSDVVVGANTFVITYRGGDGNDVRLHDKRTAALPAAVTGLTATAANSFQVDLTWNPSPASDYVSVYTIKRATTSGGPYTTIGTSNTPGYSDTTTTYSTTYYYVVSASNYLGSAPDSIEASTATSLPPVPSVPGSVVAAAGDSKVSLSWSSALAAESYNILRATTPGGPYTTIATGVTGMTYTDATAVNGTSYYYVVTATNVSGTSSGSTEVGGVASPGGYSYWPFNEASGSTSADVWGARTATLFSSSVTRVAGVSGNGLRFDGTSASYATLPAGVVSSLTGDFTISGWVKFDALQNNQRILDFGSSTTNYMFISQNTGSTLRYGIRIGSPGEQGITTGTLSLAAGKWFHVAVTMSGTTTITTTIYVNGVPAAAPTTAIANRPSGVTATANYFGKSQFSDPLLKGTLDDVRIYTRALNATEIASMVSALAPAAPANLTGTSATGAVAPISLNWTASPQATSYNIKRATTAGGPYTVIASGVVGTTYVDTTATNGTYYYVVTSISGAFEGLSSNQASVVLLPAVVPASPAPVATGWNGRVDLNWAPANGATNYDVKRATTSGGPYVTVGSVPYTSSSAPAKLIYSDTTVTNGAAYYYVIAASNAAGFSAASVEVSATPFNDAVANAWAHADVGAVGFSGNAGYSGGTYTLYGSGADIWTTVDSFHFLYKPLSGDGAIMARIVTQSTTAETAASAKAGIMIRDNLTAVNSLNATVDRTPNSVVEFIRRSVTTTNAVATTLPNLSLPRWVRLVRSGNTFTAYHSADGLVWTTVLMPAPIIAMGANTSVGLVFCANANGKRGQATFDHVSVATAAPAINSATTATATFGVPFSYAITATNTPGLFTATGLPAGLTLNDATGVISGTPTAVGAGTYAVTLTAVNAIGASASVPLTITVAKRLATVTLENLAQVYDGTQKVVTATTSPTGLAVDITYNGSAVAPTEAGSYTVVGTVHDTLNYEPASATATLVVAKIPGALLLNNLSLSYDGTSRLATATTTPAGLTVLYTYDGLPLVIAPLSGDLVSYAAAIGQTLFVNTTGGATGVAYGSNDAGYAINSDLGTAAVHAGVLTVGQTAVLRVSVLADTGTYTGTTANGVTTQSATASGGAFKIVGVAASSDYTFGPVSAGNHTVTATIVDAHYSGSVTGTVVVAQATPVITWNAPAAITYGTPLSAVQLNASADTPGSFVYTPAAGTVLDAGSDQPLSVSFTATDTVDYTPANAATTITVNKATATVTLSNLLQTYTGSPRVVTGTTSPAGLPLVIAYNGAATAPTDAGSYTVVATINHANYVGSATGTLVIGKAGAVVTLGGLNQSYDGTPRIVTATTSPVNLTVTFTYNGSATAPTYPGTYAVVATIDDPDYAGSVSGTLAIKTTVLVRHAPLMNSDIDGSLQQLLPENTTLNSGAMISGDLLVPGTPAVQLNGSPVFGGTLTGSGSSSPSNYTITLNSNTLLRYLVRRIDPIAMPVVATPPATVGTRDVTINSASQSIGNFATLRNLTLNNGAGLRAIPAGTYGTIVLNGTSGLTLGVAGATEPAVYNLQSLSINTQSGNTALQIVGPVILTLANGTQIAAQAGASTHPEWLTLQIANGGFTINGSVIFHGSVVAPNGTVTLNSSAQLNGTVAADRLTLNGTSLVNDPNL